MIVGHTVVKQITLTKTLALFICRNILAYVYIPVVQKEFDVFRVSVWNNH